MDDMWKKTNWLKMRLEELQNAYLFKLEGGKQIWVESDYVLDVDDFIKLKLNDIDNFMERSTK
jgi:hypothetical protein